MPTAYLHGKSKPCPTCKGSGKTETIVVSAREFETADGRRVPLAPVFLNCPACKGTCRKPLTPAPIAAATVAESRRHYWPQFEERIAFHG